MVSSIKRLNKAQKIGAIIQILSFIGCCFGIEGFTYWVWIGIGLNCMGSIYFIDKWGKEGKTWFKKLDKKRDKNLTRKPSETIFFMSIIETMIVSSAFIVEFWIKDFSKQLPVMGTMVIISLIFLMLIAIVVDKTQKEVEILIDSMEKKKKNDNNDTKK